MTNQLPAWDPTLPASTAICVGDPAEKTLAELTSNVLTVARSLGPLQRGQQVLVACKDRYFFAVGTLAVWKAGGVVALPPNTQIEALRALLDSPDPKERPRLLHDGATAAVEALGGTDLRSWLARPGTVSEPEPPSFAENQVLAVLYTSGSRDRARAFMKTAGQLLGEARMLASSLLRPTTQLGAPLVSTVPAHHIYGLLFSVLAPLAAGIPFLRNTPFFPESVAAAVADHDAGTLISVPAHLRSLEALNPGTLPDTLRLFSSGAPLPAETAEMLHRKFGLAVREVFGSTETGGIAHRLSPPGGPWTPLPGVTIDVDEDDTLLVNSPFVGPRTSHPYPCADRAQLLDDGRFLHLGRADDVVKVGGKRVDTGEVEQRLRNQDGVVDAAVAVYESSTGRQKELRAAVAVAPASMLTPAMLRERLQQHLDPVVVPRVIRVFASLPRSSTGKLPRADLDALLDDRVQRFIARRRTPISPDPESAEVELEASPDWEVFEGHFTHLPIVPGAVQLSVLAEQCSAIWPDLGPLARVSRLKFMAPLKPGVKALARLRRKNAQSRVDFELRAGDNALTRGILTFESPS